MPQFLEPRTIETLHVALARKRSELVHSRIGYGDLTIQQFPDAMDEVVAASQRDVAVDMVNRHALLLAQIDGALQRLANGEYGFCGECQSPISLKRLFAVPWAAFCRPCQEIADGQLSTNRPSAAADRLTHAA